MVNCHQIRLSIITTTTHLFAISFLNVSNQESSNWSDCAGHIYTYTQRHRRQAGRQTVVIEGQLLSSKKHTIRIDFHRSKWMLNLQQEHKVSISDLRHCDLPNINYVRCSKWNTVCYLKLATVSLICCVVFIIFFFESTSIQATSKSIQYWYSDKNIPYCFSTFTEISFMLCYH